MADHTLHGLVEHLRRLAPDLVRGVAVQGVAVQGVAVQGVAPPGDLVVAAVTIDSRTVSEGSLFCALVGTGADGHDYVAAAAAAGAVAAIVDRELPVDLAQIVVTDTALASALAAAWILDEPSRDLAVVGVTGTNGKTTIVTMLEHVCSRAGRGARSLGTLSGKLTTAAAPAFQASLADARAQQIEIVAAEVSSHALDQRRVDGTHFAVALFTNLSQDHLDYHPDMEAYFAAKARLFTAAFTEVAIIDISDPWGRRLADSTAVAEVVEVDGAAIAERAAISRHGSEFEWRGHRVQLPIAGRFNVANAVLVAEAARALGLSDDDVCAGLASVPQVPGRFEYVDQGQPFGVVVDYSHTPASLSEAIRTAAELTTGRVIAVFGSAGDRDPGKRPLMGSAASAADVLVVTSDNPRSEEPEAIIDEVVAGVTSPEWHRNADRREAIRLAVDLAAPDDIVLIAGKGHENYQIIGDVVRDFDDRVEARAALADAGWEHGA